MSNKRKQVLSCRLLNLTIFIEKGFYLKRFDPKKLKTSDTQKETSSKSSKGKLPQKSSQEGSKTSKKASSTNISGNKKKVGTGGSGKGKGKGKEKEKPLVINVESGDEE